jgi:hypothetical protein
MTHIHSRGASVLALLLLSTSAQAQVTADQVWQKWKDMSTTYGQTVTTTSEVRTGDTLVISGLNIASTFDGGSMTGTIETVNLREQGDGTVEVTMSPEYPLTVVTEDPDMGKTTVNMTVRQPDLKVIASGSETDTAYDLTAPSIKVSVSEVTADDKPYDLALDIDVTSLVGKYAMTSGEAAKITSNMTAESLGMVMAVKDPETNSTVNVKGTMATLAGTSANTVVDTSMTDMAAALAAGFATDGSFTYGATDFTFDVVEDGSTTNAKATLGGGSINFGLDAARMQYGGASQNVAITASGTDIPFPELAIKYADSAFNFMMPALKSETPGDFAVLTKIIDLTVSDEVWDMVDPGKALPRDPATLVIDTTGKANWLVDIFQDSETLPSDAIPGQLHALDITELTLKAVGAAVTGAGSFTFDNSDLTTFQGVPAPTGKLNLKIEGANALLDKLIAMGLVPEDQAMGARMMMGLFAKQGEGEDTLTSEIEFKDKGFFANGQRLQ